MNGFQDCKVYPLGKGTEVFWLNGTLIQVPSQDDFHFEYILYIPDNIEEQTTLIVEGSNISSHSTDNMSEAKEAILKEGLYPSLPIYKIANELGLPVLYPLFPRVYNGEETIYNHMLATNSLMKTTPKLKEYGLERVDLQLLAMFEDAKKRLQTSGIHIDEKFVIDGFSASAKFANRFTILHPECVKMCIAGGVSGILTLPVKEFCGNNLLWPIGLGNIETLTGDPMNENKIEQFKNIKQVYYMGREDQNNPFVWNQNHEPCHKEMIKQNELIQIDQIFGSSSMSERWKNAQELYKKFGVNASFYTYDGIGHDPRPAYQDILSELESLLSQEKIK